MNTLRIKKLGVLSVGKMYAVMALIISLLIAIPYGLFIIIFSVIGGVGAGSRDGSAGLMLGGGGIVFGIIVMIGIPIMYSIIGFISGIIGALIYNILASFVGGIEIEVENIGGGQNMYRG